MEKVIIKFKGIEYNAVQYLKDNENTALYSFFYRNCTCSGNTVNINNSSSCSTLTSIKFTEDYKNKNVALSENRINYYGKLYIFLKCVIALEKKGLNLRDLFSKKGNCSGTYRRNLPNKTELLQKLYRLATMKSREIDRWW